ncbi:MAG: hypothetical protein JWM98_1786 [Thermoleophilia bacterium]|nr:hypothetical protein [Thermoleophilia bacterium]
MTGAVEEPAHAPSRWQRVQARARALRQEVLALYLACRDPETPRLARVLAGVVVAYALSPIDLIPDVIPVLGYLDDLILLPLGIALVLRLIPAEVMVRSRARAAELHDRPVSRGAAVAVVATWLVLAGVAVWVVLRLR